MPQSNNLLTQRLQKRKPGWLDIRSDLRHFALINYAVLPERLAPHIPTDRFEIPTYDINGRQLALLSVVPFVDDDFCFYRLLPWFKFRFPQTNFRVYVIDRATGEPVVWFFGTTLGSRLVALARGLWKIPWHRAQYEVDCVFDEENGRSEHGRNGRYTHYHFSIQSDWCNAHIEIEDTGSPVELSDEERLVLTHPVDGYFYRLDGRVGGYSIWHNIIPLTSGKPRNLYFSLFEDLAIMSRDEMQQPHSIFLCPSISFDIYMPPKPK
ncbi:MAG: DUF2071 domain-containing protein [Anaerolineae bacterium]|nr:DUF2071 domain-containing protein [Anaerolineae bacterium]